MAEAWFIRVDGKEYGPADVETLRDWKADGRLLPTNEARPAGVDLWITAAEIPDLFAVPSTERSEERLPQITRSFAQILGETFRIYGRGFSQFLYLTLLVSLPSVCAQLSGSGFSPSSASNPDLSTAVASAFTLCMIGLSLAAWPVFIIGIQILAAELIAGRRPNIFSSFGEILKFWPRVVGLCVIVYGVFGLLFGLAFFILVLVAIGGSSLPIALLAMLLLVIQVWLFSGWFVRTLFWQQTAVLENADATEALRSSKQIARSGADLPWYQRPMWRGVFIASLWCALVLVLTLGPEWHLIRQYFHQIMTTTDPQAMLESLRAGAQTQGFNITGFGLGLFQTLLRPLLGIAFVVLYFDSKGST